jgi:hypothetical protein
MPSTGAPGSERNEAAPPPHRPSERFPRGSGARALPGRGSARRLAAAPRIPEPRPSRRARPHDGPSGSGRPDAALEIAREVGLRRGNARAPAAGSRETRGRGGGLVQAILFGVLLAGARAAARVPGLRCRDPRRSAPARLRPRDGPRRIFAGSGRLDRRGRDRQRRSAARGGHASLSRRSGRAVRSVRGDPGVARGLGPRRSRRTAAPQASLRGRRRNPERGRRSRRRPAASREPAGSAAPPLLGAASRRGRGSRRRDGGARGSRGMAGHGGLRARRDPRPDRRGARASGRRPRAQARGRDRKAGFPRGGGGAPRGRAPPPGGAGRAVAPRKSGSFLAAAAPGRRRGRHALEQPARHSRREDRGGALPRERGRLEAGARGDFDRARPARRPPRRRGPGRAGRPRRRGRHDRRLAARLRRDRRGHVDRVLGVGMGGAGRVRAPAHPAPGRARREQRRNRLGRSGPRRERAGDRRRGVLVRGTEVHREPARDRRRETLCDVPRARARGGRGLPMGRPSRTRNRRSGRS